MKRTFAWFTLLASGCAGGNFASRGRDATTDVPDGALPGVSSDVAPLPPAEPWLIKPLPASEIPRGEYEFEAERRGAVTDLRLQICRHPAPETDCPDAPLETRMTPCPSPESSRFCARINLPMAGLMSWRVVADNAPPAPWWGFRSLPTSRSSTQSAVLRRWADIYGNGSEPIVYAHGNTVYVVRASTAHPDVYRVQPSYTLRGFFPMPDLTRDNRAEILAILRSDDVERNELWYLSDGSTYGRPVGRDGALQFMSPEDVVSVGDQDHDGYPDIQIAGKTLRSRCFVLQHLSGWAELGHTPDSQLLTIDCDHPEASRVSLRVIRDMNNDRAHEILALVHGEGRILSAKFIVSGTTLPVTVPLGDAPVLDIRIVGNVDDDPLDDALIIRRDGRDGQSGSVWFARGRATPQNPFELQSQFILDAQVTPDLPLSTAGHLFGTDRMDLVTAHRAAAGGSLHYQFWRWDGDLRQEPAFEGLSWPDDAFAIELRDLNHNSNGLEEFISYDPVQIRTSSGLLLSHGGGRGLYLGDDGQFQQGRPSPFPVVRVIE